MRIPFLTLALVFVLAQMVPVEEAHARRGAVAAGVLGAFIGAAIYHNARNRRYRRTYYYDQGYYYDGRRKRRAAAPAAAIRSDQYPRTLGDWVINFDRDNLICMASSMSDKGTSYHVGMDVRQGGWFFSYTNQEWQSIKEGQSYDVNYVFDGRGNWGGQSTGIANGLLLQGLTGSFVESFAASLRLEIHFEGRRIDTVGLRGTRNATKAIEYCNSRAYAMAQSAQVAGHLNRGQATADPFGTAPASATPAPVSKDPFGGSHQGAAPASAPAPVPAPVPASDAAAVPEVSSADGPEADDEALPQKVGDCVETEVEYVGTRLTEVADSGTVIEFTNGLSLVSYDQVTAAAESQEGDKVKACLEALPKNCPPGDNRGKVYRIENLRTNKSFSMPDSAHACGGA